MIVYLSIFTCPLHRPLLESKGNPVKPLIPLTLKTVLDKLIFPPSS